MQKPRMRERRVVCAANRLHDGRLLIGARHWDELMVAQSEMLRGRYTGRQIVEAQQGFIDQWGNFLSRAEAWMVASAADQILRRGPGFDGPELFSENLY